MFDSTLIGISDLVAVNLQCFGLIILGYFSRKFNLIGINEENGLNIYVSYFSLPALIFSSLATLPMSQIDFNFVGIIFILKSAIFLCVLFITFVLSYKSLSKYTTIRRSAIFAIFCTQSNDFALGYPFLISLYGTSKSSLANYLYILAPIQLLILNPIGLFLIEVSKSLEDNTTDRHGFQRVCLIFKVIFQKIFINPLIFATFFGLITNLISDGNFPQVAEPFFQSISQSFSSIALFLLGLNLHGNFKLLKNFSQPLLITLVLVSVKIFLMPILNRTFVEHIKLFPSQYLNGTLSEFAFLYGTIPSAPTVYIFSNFYNIETVVISAGLVISTLLSVPLMFVSANMIRLSSQINYVLLNKDMIDTIFYTSVIGLTGSLLILMSFFFGYKLRSLTHRCSLKILLSHLMILTAGFMFKFNTTNFNFYDKISIAQYLLFNIGLFSFKLWTCFLALTIALLYAKSLCFVIKVLNRFLYTSLVVIAIYITFLVLTLNFYSHNSSSIDIYFGINRVNIIVSICISCVSICVSIVAFILFHHYKNTVNYERLSENDSASDEVVTSNFDDLISTPSSSSSVEPINVPQNRIQRTNSNIDVEDILISLARRRTNEDFKETCSNTCNSQCTARKGCNDRLRQYMHDIETAIEAVETSITHSPKESNNFHQVYHHMYLILYSVLTIIVHLSVEIFRLFDDNPSAIYVEIEFLDILLTFSHGFIMFIIFGLDIDAIIHKISNWLKTDLPVTA